MIIKIHSSKVLLFSSICDSESLFWILDYLNCFITTVSEAMDLDLDSYHIDQIS